MMIRFLGNYPSRSPQTQIHLPALFPAALVLLLSMAGFASPAVAQNCFTQNGQTICCDGNGNCSRR
jgi:hypothetical protein